MGVTLSSGSALCAKRRGGQQTAAAAAAAAAQEPFKRCRARRAVTKAKGEPEGYKKPAVQEEPRE